jgi:hypothetical protein
VSELLSSLPSTEIVEWQEFFAMQNESRSKVEAIAALRNKVSSDIGKPGIFGENN